MNAVNIRPVTDLRNKYPDVESDVQKGPVFFTKNGYAATVLAELNRADALCESDPRHFSCSQSQKILNERRDARRVLNTSDY